MNPEQVQIIKLTFAQVMRDKDKVGRMFYGRLFAVAPDVKPLFRGDIAAQSRKLMDTLALAVGMLRDMPTLAITLEGLAKRHSDYGVKDEHYDKVGEALLWALEKGLGDAFTPQVREAWASLYAAVAQIMRGAVKGKTAAVA